jgi:hypothetical protein
VQLTDSWHFFKMLMIVLLCLAIVMYEPFVGRVADFVMYGLAWNLTFSFHYNLTFRP